MTRRPPVALILPVLLIVVMFLPNAGAFAGGIAVVPQVNPTQPPGPLVSAMLVFNHHDAANASSAPHAISVSAAHPIPATFSWTARGGKLGTQGTVAVQSVKIALLLFSLPGFTNTVVEQPTLVASSGSANMSLDYGTTTYLSEGLYQLVGTIVSPNGSSLWSESFFIHVLAPYHLTAATIVALAVALYELIGFAVGDRQKKERSSAEPGPASGGG